MSNKAIFGEFGTAYRVVWPGFHDILIPAVFILNAAHEVAAMKRLNMRVDLDIISIDLAGTAHGGAVQNTQNVSVNIQSGRVFIGGALFANEVTDEEAARILGIDWVQEGVDDGS